MYAECLLYVLWTSNLYVATLRTYRMYMSLSRYDFQSVWFSSGFPWERVAANENYQGRYWNNGSYRLQSWFKTVYGRHHDLINQYGIFVSQITTDVLRLSWWQSPYFPLLWIITIFSTRVILLVQSEAEAALPCGATEFAPIF